MTEFCPRAIENGGGPNSPFRPPMNGEMTWRQPDNTCSYCGSGHPDEFMKAVEAGVELTPTDKSYKAYLKSPNFGGPAHKFYFQHLSKDQMMKVIELYNEKKINFSSPGSFYVWPFFMEPKGA